MQKNDEKKLLRETDYYRERIIEMAKNIRSPEILQYIYIIVSDIEKEDK